MPTDPRDARPLAGVTVVDITQIIAGPFATMSLEISVPSSISTT